jgi:hypothetical protein
MRFPGLSVALLCLIGVTGCDDTSAEFVFETFEAHCMLPARGDDERLKDLTLQATDVAVPFMTLLADELQVEESAQLRIFDFSGTNQSEKHDLNCAVYAENTDPEEIRRSFLAKEHYVVKSVIDLKALPIDGTGNVYFFSSTLHDGNATALMIRDGSKALLFSNFRQD